jgi:DNA-binding NarL/FixJ family response regulator
VAVVNLDLPGMGGMNLLWLLRQVRPRTRMIVLTAESSSSDVIRAIREHVFAYFSKPLVVEVVVEMTAQAAAAAHWEDGIKVLSAQGKCASRPWGSQLRAWVRWSINPPSGCRRGSTPACRR